jgi:hypothetical protein
MFEGEDFRSIDDPDHAIRHGFIDRTVAMGARGEWHSGDYLALTAEGVDNSGLVDLLIEGAAQGCSLWEYANLAFFHLSGGRFTASEARRRLARWRGGGGARLSG